MKYLALAALGIGFLLPGCRNLPQGNPPIDTTDTKILVNSETNNFCLRVRVSSPVHASGEKMGEVNIAIINGLEQDVFIRVNGLDNLGGVFSCVDSNGQTIGQIDFSGVLTFQSGYTDVYRMVPANAGKRHIPGDKIIHIDGKIDGQHLDLRNCIGGNQHVCIPLIGYVLQSGQRFNERVYVPIAIIDDQDSSGVKKTTAATED